MISDTFGAYSSGLVSPLVVDLVGKDHFGEAEGFTNGVNEVKKQTGLLEVVLIVAVLNGSLSSMGSLIPIMIAAHKTAMVISRYSFTIALMGVVVACGAALGSMFGTQLFKKFTIFSMTILATLIALMTTFAIFATVGLLNTILIASAPLMTTILTTVSGATNIRYALILLVALEVITFLVELKVSHKVKVASIISSVKE